MGKLISQNHALSYVLVSAVRDEAAYIKHTLQSVVAQSHLPLRWVIVSDGSTDETDEIVKNYAKATQFIQLVRQARNPQRNFASKVFAIRAGLNRLAGLAYDLVGNLDGDVSLDPLYYETLIQQFALDPTLGIGGGQVYEYLAGGWRKEIRSTDLSVAGAVQMFRRECFESIGGYLPLPEGGVDGVAEGMARLRGWKVRTFPELVVHHHRPVGTAGRSKLGASFDFGWREGLIGYDPAFELLRSLNRMRSSPFFLAGLIHMVGYIAARLFGRPLELPANYVRFLRQEQRSRIRRAFGLKKSSQ